MMRGLAISPEQAWRLAKDAVNGWIEDRAASMGAALAYYTAFSIAPLLIITIAVAALFFGHDAAQEALTGQMRGLLGDAGGSAIEDILGSTSGFGGGLFAMTVGIGALVIGATTAFVELQDDLDRIWKAKPRVASGILNLVRSRLLSLGMVLFIGFLLAVSLALSAAVSALGSYLFPGMEIVLQVITFVVSFGVVTALFAMIYKVLPNVDIDWENVWVGAAITALLFEIGKFLIGLYLGKSSVGESFGAAGPFVVMMVWIYYSTQIFLLGAEFTRAHALARQPKTTPERDARQQAAEHPGSSPSVAAQRGTAAVDSAPISSTRPAQTFNAFVPESRSTWLTRFAGAATVGLIAGFAVTRVARRGALEIRARNETPLRVARETVRRLAYRSRH